MLEDASASEDGKNHLFVMYNTFEQVVALVGQASNRTDFYRRSLVLESVITGYRRVKDILSENEKSFTDPSDVLFGEKFEDQIIKLSKSKQKSKDVFTALGTRDRKPFQSSPLPKRGAGNSKGQNFNFSKLKGNFRGKNKSKSFSTQSSEFTLSSGVSLCPFSSVKTVSKQISSGSISREDKILSTKLGKINEGPRDPSN